MWRRRTRPAWTRRLASRGQTDLNLGDTRCFRRQRPGFTASSAAAEARRTAPRPSHFCARRCCPGLQVPTNKYGEKLKDQVEERLRFYDNGEAPRKNIDVMKEVMEELKAEGKLAPTSSKKKDKGNDDDDEAARKAAKKAAKAEKRKSEGGDEGKSEKKKKKKDKD